MNTRRFRSVYSLPAIFLVLLVTATAYPQDLNNTIVKTITPGNHDVVCVKNPHFDVKINTWDRNEIKIEYHFSLEAKTEEEVQSFYRAFENVLDEQLRGNRSGRICINVGFNMITRSNNKIRLKMKGDQHTYLLQQLDGTLEISMPQTLALDVQSSFNTIDIGTLDADATIKINSCTFSMENCRNLNLNASFSKKMKIGKCENATLRLNSSDVEMGAIQQDLTLDASFSNIDIEGIGNKATFNLNSTSFSTSDIRSMDLQGSFIRSFRVHNLEEARININSSKFEANAVNNVVVERTSFSTFTIETTGEMEIGTSTSTTFNLENVNAVNATKCSFSNFNIGNLNDRFTADARSGNIVIDNVEKGFDKIDLSGSFLTTKIHIADGSNYTVTANLEFPNYDFGNLNMKEHIKEMSHEQIEGWKGNNEQARSSIHLECQSCKLTVR